MRGTLGEHVRDTPAGLALGTMVIDRLEREDFLGPSGKLRTLETAVTGKMTELLKKSLISDYTVIGAMAAATPPRSDLDSVKHLVHDLFQNGLCVYYSGHGPYRIRMLLPGGCLAPSDLAEPFGILEEGLKRHTI